MEELKKLLITRMADHKLGGEMVASLVCHNANLLSEGKYVAKRYKNGVLTVVVANSAEANNLQIALSNLKKRINERVHPHPINRIIIKTERV